MTLKVENIQRGLNPFDIIDCPMCGRTDFTSLDHSSVWCDECNTRFFARHTTGDPGFVVDAFLDATWVSKVKYPEAIKLGLEPYLPYKGDTERGWLAIDDRANVKVIYLNQIRGTVKTVWVVARVTNDGLNDNFTITVLDGAESDDGKPIEELTLCTRSFAKAQDYIQELRDKPDLLVVKVDNLLLLPTA